MYKRRVKPVLVSLSDLYLELESILVDISKPSSCSILYCLLATALRKFIYKYP